MSSFLEAMLCAALIVFAGLAFLFLVYWYMFVPYWYEYTARRAMRVILFDKYNWNSFTEEDAARLFDSHGFSDHHQMFFKHIHRKQGPIGYAGGHPRRYKFSSRYDRKYGESAFFWD